MSGRSAIEWTEATWNPVTGCSKVSPGCAHCYAESLTRRFASTWNVPDLPWTPANAELNVRLHPARLEQPLRWARPRMIFVNSMSDLFHELVPDEFIADVFGVMASAPRHVFQVLTKRPERARKLLGGAWIQNEVLELAFGTALLDPPWPLPNVWIGTSIENRRFVDRADELRATLAAVRFISAEPLLGPLIARGGFFARGSDGSYHADWPDGYIGDPLSLTSIDWLICGGESGPGHRRLDLEWVRDLRDACRDAGTAFFVKQLGGARPGTTLADLPRDLRIREMPERGRTSRAQPDEEQVHA